MAKNPFEKKIKSILKANNCKFHRQIDGSHERWYSPIVKGKFTVVMSTKSRDTVNAFLNDAGIKEKV